VEISEFWLNVEQELARHDLLQHPFYQAWSAGKLTIGDLKFYAQQYFHQVSAFPSYLTALHSRLPDGPVRRDLLANAFDEECAGTPHSEMWLRFLEAVGGSGSESSAGEALPEVSDLVQTFRKLAAEAPVAAAFGALFAYESQVPRIAAEKERGLRKHYGADDRACSYFTLHKTADVHHSGVWRKILSALVRQDERNAEQALEGISRAARALWMALDGIERERCCGSARN